MKRGRFTEEQIIGVLKEHEAGAKTADLARKHGISEAPAPPSDDGGGRDRQFVFAMVASCFCWALPRRSSSARRIGPTVSGSGDNIETRCSFVRGRSPASTKTDNDVKPTREIVENQLVASGI